MEYELIEGRLVRRNAPSLTHQQICLRLCTALDAHIKKRGGDCRVVIAPFCVILSEENATAVQPDISVICQEGRLQEDACYGAPDIAIEIVSPANKKYDYINKLYLYQKYDVQEYWIVDPQDQTILLYQLTKQEAPSTYNFEDEVTSFILDDFHVVIQDLVTA